MPAEKHEAQQEEQVIVPGQNVLDAHANVGPQTDRRCRPPSIAPQSKHERETSRSRDALFPPIACFETHEMTMSSPDLRHETRLDAQLFGIDRAGIGRSERDAVPVEAHTVEAPKTRFTVGGNRKPFHEPSAELVASGFESQETSLVADRQPRQRCRELPSGEGDCHQHLAALPRVFAARNAYLMRSRISARQNHRQCAREEQRDASGSRKW
jgi:hypothetical protein